MLIAQLFTVFPYCSYYSIAIKKHSDYSSCYEFIKIIKGSFTYDVHDLGGRGGLRFCDTLN